MLLKLEGFSSTLEPCGCLCPCWPLRGCPNSPPGQRQLAHTGLSRAVRCRGQPGPFCGPLEASGEAGAVHRSRGPHVPSLCSAGHRGARCCWLRPPRMSSGDSLPSGLPPARERQAPASPAQQSQHGPTPPRPRAGQGGGTGSQGAGLGSGLVCHHI